MSTRVVAHKIRLSPNKTQATYFCKACGTARFAYNWGLAEWQQQYKLGKKPSAFNLKKQFRQIAPTKYPWVREVTKCAAEQAFNDLSAAYQHFFKKIGKYPKFKKKGKCKDSFYLSNDQFNVQGRRLRVPKLGWVKMREELRFSGKILCARVTRTADRWFASIQVETSDMPKQCESQAIAGIDVGLNTFVCLSDGNYVLAPKPLRTYTKKLARLQRQLCRKKIGSSNRRKAVMKVARLHSKISNIRKDFLHKLTTKLVNSYGVLALEDLNVKGMLRNHCLAKSIADVGFYEFRRQLEYKSKWVGSEILFADQWFPSSKTCSQCGRVKDATPLDMRTYTCDCGNHTDRDLNAAINIMLTTTGGLPGSYACGQMHLWDISNSRPDVGVLSALGETGISESAGSAYAAA